MKTRKKTDSCYFTYDHNDKRNASDDEKNIKSRNSCDCLETLSEDKVSIRGVLQQLDMILDEPSKN